MFLSFHNAGVEKNNDDSRQNYFSSNKWDAPGDILRTEARLEHLSSQGYCREKHEYTNRNTHYREGGGIEESRTKHAFFAPIQIPKTQFLFSIYIPFALVFYTPTVCLHCFMINHQTK